MAIQMDHSVDSEVEKLFHRIEQEQSGKLDVLVNNAYAGVSNLSSLMVITTFR